MADAKPSQDFSTVIQDRPSLNMCGIHGYILESMSECPFQPFMERHLVLAMRATHDVRPHHRSLRLVKQTNCGERPERIIARAVYAGKSPRCGSQHSSWAGVVLAAPDSLITPATA